MPIADRDQIWTDAVLRCFAAYRAEGTKTSRDEDLLFAFTDADFVTEHVCAELDRRRAAAEAAATKGKRK